MPWAIKWRSESQLSGKVERFVGCRGAVNPPVPVHLDGYTTALFRTREEARGHIRQHFGYIRRRPDLRAEPHGWKMPVPVKVRVSIEEVA